MQKAVLFDFDGTLFFETNTLNKQCFEMTLLRMGYPPPDKEKIDRSVGMTIPDIASYLLESNDPILCRRFEELLFQCVPEYIARHVRPIEHEREWLDALHQKAKLAICTNGDPRYTLPMLEALGIKDCFDAIWTNTPGYTKATAIPKLIRMLHADAAIFAGDRKMDVDAARSAHIPIAAIRNAELPHETDEADTIAVKLWELFDNINSMLDQEITRRNCPMNMTEKLKDYMLTPAPSGYESEMAYKMVADLKPFCEDVHIDRVGNVIGKIPGKRGSEMPRLMVFGHMDQLGFIVRRVEPNGFIQVDRLGGIPEKVLPGLQLLIRSEDGNWHRGVFGPKAHHATPAEEKYKVDLVTSLYVDIGATSAEEVHALGIEVGCPVIYRPAFEELLGKRVTGTAVDNRGACATLVSVAENLSENRPDCDVYLVGTVWEEFNLRGAMMAARTVKPDMAIMLDVTLAGDTMDLGNRFEDKLGQGACVQLYSFHGRGTLNGTLPHEPMFKLCKETAQKEKIPLQRFASLGIVTDAAYLQLEQEGVAILEMGFPARYTHTPIEVCDVGDLEVLAKLVSAMARNITADFHLSRY